MRQVEAGRSERGTRWCGLCGTRTYGPDSFRGLVVSELRKKNESRDASSRLQFVASATKECLDLEGSFRVTAEAQGNYRKPEMCVNPTWQQAVRVPYTVNDLQKHRIGGLGVQGQRKGLIPLRCIIASYHGGFSFEIFWSLQYHTPEKSNIEWSEGFSEVWCDARGRG